MITTQLGINSGLQCLHGYSYRGGRGYWNVLGKIGKFGKTLLRKF